MSDVSLTLGAEMAMREKARRSFADYLPYVQGKSWCRTRMSDYLAREVQNFVMSETGHSYDMLVIETPPQHGKSATLTESFPSWYLGRFPRDRVIVASYNDETAERFARRNKEKLKQYGNTLFQVGIGRIDRATEYELNNGAGRLISRGIMSGITGNPANLLVIDDPIKNRVEADSPSYRAKLWDEWQNSLKSRLQAGAKVILIMTPWHEDDLASRCLSSEPNCRLIRLPVEAEEDDPLGRSPGDALCPEIGKDNAWLHDFKESYVNDPEGGARAWAALYQCTPRVEGGNLVKRSWWQTYDPKEVTQFGNGCISVDATFKDGANNDFVAITVWGKLNNDYYLRYVLNRHLDFPGTVEALRSVRRLYPDVRAVLVEDKANGSAIIQTLQKEMFCIPVNPKGGKVARVNAVSSAIESGHVYIPEHAPWKEEYLDQWTRFPSAAHDDMVDSSSQALSYLLRLNGTIYGTPTSEQVRSTRETEREAESLTDNSRLFDPYGFASSWLG